MSLMNEDKILRIVNKLKQKERQNEMHLTVPEKVETVKPSGSTGITGDKKIVKEGTDIYQYVKVDKQWYKVKLEKA